MNGSSPEEDKSLELSRAALVQKAATKAEALYARLGEITGMSRQEEGSDDTSVLQRKADTLSRFVKRHAHMLNGVAANGVELDEEGEAATPAGEPPAEEPKKGVKLSDRAWELVGDAVASMIMNDGKIEKDEGDSPIAKMMAENEWSRAQWDLVKPSTAKLGVLSLNRTGPNHTPYDSITLEMDNIAAIEELIAEGKLPEYLQAPLDDIKLRKVQEATGDAGEEATIHETAGSEPTPDELKGIEADRE
jgi:hypothetical protein